jgi:hypothetical protein
MLKAEIQPGIDYALREKRLVGAPFQRVRIIEHIRKNKWKAKWIEPNPGLVDYIESGQLIDLDGRSSVSITRFSDPNPLCGM